jgi:DNA segregation ATPase FtsK/SpoIIIE, S-DNA-T family
MAAARTNAQQTARTAVKGGSRPSPAPRPAGATRVTTAPPASTPARKTAAGPASRSARPGTQARAPVPGHRGEIVALVLLAVAVFLFVILLAAGAGGVLGRGSATGLRFAFGNLALVVPVALLAMAVITAFDVSVKRSYWFVGALIFLLGLFLLVAAGAPPFGSHSADYFVRAEFQGRSGGLGEAVYAMFHSLAGTAGVAIIGWVAVIAGFSLATGMTVGRIATGTKRAAGAVRDTAERGMTVVKDRDVEDADFGIPGYFAATGTAVGWNDSASPAPATRLGPVDLVGDGFESDVADASTRAGNPFGQEFDDWSDGRPAERSPLAPAAGGTSGSGVLDGAHAFSDLFGPSTPVSSARAAGAAGGAAVLGAAVAIGAAGAAVGAAGRSALGAADLAGSMETAQELADASAAPSRPTGAAGAAEEAAGDFDVHQETLPGLARAPRQTELVVEVPNYLLPDSELLKKSTPLAPGRANERDTAGVVLEALGQFGVEARVVGMVVGPRVTRYELQLAPGTKVAKVSALKDDLAYALATTEIRILAPIPGKSAVGVEVPNQRPDFVTLGDIYREFPRSAGPLMVWLGKDISGKPVYADLTKLPHLLIAGTTGSGKSGCVNCIVSSILLRSTPEQVRLIMIDPKKVELSHYDRIPHLLVPVVTNMKDAAGVLHNVAKEMEDRYELMELEHSRSLADMNKARSRRGERPLPYILIVIDELADLMMVSPQEVEEYVIRLAQKSRAVGIHLVVATQRPSADVITGMIKANIPSRIAFAVSSQIDSRVILDVNGAETLLGRGDMLFKPLGSSHMERVQGAYITEEEIALLVNHWRRQAEPEFREELLRRPPDPKEARKAEEEGFDPDSDDLLADAAQLVIETGSASVSMLQRRLRVGYTRAGRLIDMLERRGVVGPWEGSKPRQILVDADEAEHLLAALRLEQGGGRMGDETTGD